MKVFEHGSEGLPSNEIMDNIQRVRHTGESNWTAFVLTVKRNGLYEVDYYDDLNPTLESGSALLLLAYTHYHIEPTSDFSKLQLKSAIKAESFKKTLNYACMRNDIETVKEKLINIKLSTLNKKGPDRKTPLHIACLNENIEIVTLLVEAGADLKIKYHGETPFALACRKGNVEIIKYLISQGENANEIMVGKVTPLHLISSSGNQEIVHYILERITNINAVTNRKRSALHYAVEDNNLEAAKVLIDNGIDMELLEEYKRSALSLACDRNKPEMAGLLLENGANIHSTGQGKVTPLHSACERGFIEVVRVLLQHQPNLHAKATLYSMPRNENLKETPIETAKRLGYDEIVDLLSSKL
ncbi:ankyrin repeat-containing protein [Bacillus anthracis]|nr:ankyrin repeat domain protein [Bacillus anthracis str. CDC 684]ACQ47569.1 ankyrin repeat domain protein [Bacillus anthracis str. A0248]AFH84697.1 Ankyrin repeat domain protein [Bacillus anthracis str. H9401]AHK39469.1 Ankyrin repeat domain protein [Bacillus anthracis str. SVA11]AIM07219.1 ankyrin repeat-containing protein [Bacillus anthracis]EDR20587.1 ankyrin repeat domain protein [Bacillus anthracis str. A0488]EDR89887.1 ankyrin repeat domain protein [Bacillus anthracis str. A0193]EDR94